MYGTKESLDIEHHDGGGNTTVDEATIEWLRRSLEQRRQARPNGPDDPLTTGR